MIVIVKNPHWIECPKDQDEFMVSYADSMGQLSGWGYTHPTLGGARKLAKQLNEKRETKTDIVERF